MSLTSDVRDIIDGIDSGMVTFGRPPETVTGRRLRAAVCTLWLRMAAAEMRLTDDSKDLEIEGLRQTCDALTRTVQDLEANVVARPRNQ